VSGASTGRGTVCAVFADETALRKALERVAREAPGARVLEVRSSVPLPEDLAELAPTRRSRAHIWGIAGGASGGFAGWLLAFFTAKAFPVVTGHLPIVPMPTSGIVIYEGIAFGVVLATTICVLREGGLVRRRGDSAGVDRTVGGDPTDPGSIVVIFEDEAARGERLGRMLAFP
jgi:ActD protein